jgi:hypothetical protein
MGNVAGYRAAWIEAQSVPPRWDRWLADRTGDPPARDLGNETLAEVLRGNILVHNHCYRADEMAQMIDIAREFGYTIRSFHHGVEAYKVADLLARGHDLRVDVGRLGRLQDGGARRVRGNLALVHAAGARAIVHSDDPIGAQRLNQDAAKAHGRGPRARHRHPRGGRDPLDHRQRRVGARHRRSVGSLEVGKQADVVLWSGNPFSVYTKPRRCGSTASCATTAATSRAHGAPTSSWATSARGRHADAPGTFIRRRGLGGVRDPRR